VGSPLIKDGENWLRNGSTGARLEYFGGLDFLEVTSEKGSTRKDTGNWVTR
jgi:hypothetical protein